MEKKKIEHLNELTRNYTTYNTFEEFVAEDESPILAFNLWKVRRDDQADIIELANAFDRIQHEKGSKLRAFRG